MDNKPPNPKYLAQTQARSVCPKRKEYMRQYRVSNKARRIEYYEQWVAANHEKVAAYSSASAQRIKARNAKFYAENKDRIDAERQANKLAGREKAKQTVLANYLANKDAIDAQRLELKNSHKTRELERLKRRSKTHERHQYLQKYYAANSDKLRGYRKHYNENRLKTDPEYKLRHLLSKRMRGAIKRLKIAKTFHRPVKYLGCTLGEFRAHIESQFEPWMSWDNHGKFGWHIDHIKPLSSFDLSDPKQFAEASHYTNLRPLHWRKNLQKWAHV